MPALLPAATRPVCFLVVVLMQAVEVCALGLSLAEMQRRRESEHSGTSAMRGERGDRPGGWGHWSPAELTQLWDARTLASFSISQLDAFARIIAGRCPLLSRSVQCSDSSRSGAAAQREPASWRKLATAYLDEEANLAKSHVVRMMRHLWSNYEAFAFGKDEMKPVSGIGVNNWGGLGQTIVDALDTLWLMDFHHEFHKAATWVEEKLRFDVDVNVNTFETSIRQLGGLVSAYALSGREVFLEKAKDLGDRLLLAYANVIPKPKKPKATTSLQTKGRLVELLEQMGLPKTAMNALTGETEADDLVLETDSLPKGPQLPFSDVNLLTGEVQNLAGFVSLSEAYVPVEWKALALYTGNCSYALPQDEVLKLVNNTSDLSSRAFAPIMLRPDGAAFPSWENRISLGGRGDSFYEYLLKDWIFSGDEVHPLTRSLWDAFRQQLPSLLVMVDPAQAAVTRAANAQSAPEPRSWLGAFSGKPDTLRQWKRRRRLRQRRQQTQYIPDGEFFADLPPPRDQGHLSAPAMAKRRKGRCFGGACGGWYESAGDASLPWAFLREVTFAQTVPKMDHLICFLPGTLALDVFHRGRPGASRRLGKEAFFSRTTGSNQHAIESPGNVSLLTKDRATELRLADKLMQSCIHMYFRTTSDLAPEITRFTNEGFVDDLGSMHNILRPETIESLVMLWRTTKAQIYRNWGQRLLSAFSRTRTKFGFASLHNVNDPWTPRDDMPSFFVAETMKYLFLLFSPDTTLPLQDMVLTTEAHPVPIIAKAKGARWLCGKDGIDQPSSTTGWATPSTATATSTTTVLPPFSKGTSVQSSVSSHLTKAVTSLADANTVHDADLFNALAGPWDFNGTSFTDFPSSTTPETTFSVEFYAKCGSSTMATVETRNSSSCGSGFRSPLTSRDYSPQSGYIFYLGPDDRWAFWVGSGPDAEQSIANPEHQWRQLPGPTVKAGVWTHLLGVVNTTAEEARFHVDGVLAATIPVNFIPNRQRPLRLGAGANDSGSPDFYFTGEVRDVSIRSQDGFQDLSEGASPLPPSPPLPSPPPPPRLASPSALPTSTMRPAESAVIADGAAPAMDADMPDTAPHAASGMAAGSIAQWPGNEACWADGFTFEVCCSPPNVGNAACWDAAFTFAHCCLGSSTR